MKRGRPEGAGLRHESFRPRFQFRTKGSSIEAEENRQLYKYTDEGTQPNSRQVQGM